MLLHVKQTTLLLTVCVTTALVGASHARGQELKQKSLEEIQDLRERLTEREDENRVEDPWIFYLGSKAISVNGQYEASLEAFDKLTLGISSNDYGQLLVEQEVELEALYSLSRSLTFFAQIRLVAEEELDSDSPDEGSDTYLERGEMWLYAERILGYPVNIEVGRLDFEDDRLWWWDEDLDAIRVEFEGNGFDIEWALARELFSTRSDENKVEPEQEKVLRLLLEASWDWRPDHSVEIFAVYHDDHSRTEKPGEAVSRDKEDESDARLKWIGLRATGALAWERLGILGYWLDAAHVQGKEKELETLELPGEQPEVEEVLRHSVRGWAVDAGFTWILPTAMEPRLTLGYAIGSGDGSPENDTDREFRQTGLHGNEPGFGGVERFSAYGDLLNPELSNLSIFTVGFGLSLLHLSSLDFVYHNYTMVERADELHDSRLDAELTGEARDVGEALDIVLGIEEWETVQFELRASFFKTGAAFGDDRDEWLHGGFFAFKYAF